MSTRTRSNWSARRRSAAQSACPSTSDPISIEDPMRVDDIDLLDGDVIAQSVPHRRFTCPRQHHPVIQHAEPLGPAFCAVSKHAKLQAVEPDPVTYSSNQDRSGVTPTEQPDVPITVSRAVAPSDTSRAALVPIVATSGQHKPVTTSRVSPSNWRSTQQSSARPCCGSSRIACNIRVVRGRR